ncbi:MAG TPA: histidine kinase [Anaerolineae bacterium]|nr:histidine kinase [Anaerolineae bacterium]
MSRFRGLLPGLLLIVILPLTLALVVVAIGATTLHQNEMRTLVAVHDQQAAREAAAALDERARHQLSTLQSIADAVALGLPPDEVLRSMAHLLSDFDGGVVALNATGSVFASTPPGFNPTELLSAGVNMPPRALGFSLLPSGDILGVAPSTDESMVALGRFSAQALRLPRLTERLRSSPRARVILVDVAARILYHSGGMPIGTDASSEPGAADALRGDGGAQFVTDSSGLEWVVTFEPVPSAGWGLIIAEPWEDAVNPLLRTSLLTPLALVPAYLIAVAAIVFVARRVIRPLQQLGRQADRAGQGDYGALAQPIEGVAEVQALHATLAQMAEQIRRYQRSIQSYAAAVTRSQEEERSRLARELHDETVQALIALDQRIQMVERALARNPQAAPDKLADLRTMTASTIQEVRRVIRALRPIYLEDLGLLPALEMLTQAMGSETGLETAFVAEGEPRRLAPERELALYRVVQEALNNIVKHARATRVEVKVTYGDVLRVSVTDDGIGFSVPERADALTELGHFGLVGMRERAELIGAQLTIRSAHGSGMTVELKAPL